MCAPVPKDKWSWKYGDSCRWCGTSSKNGRSRHKGVGLCFRCFDNYRKQRNPKRQQQLKNQGKRWYERNKDNPEEKKRKYEAVIKYQHTPQYKKKLKTYIYKRRKFIYFIRSAKRYNLKRWDGLEIIIDGVRVKTPIQASRCVNSDNDKTINEIELFKKLYLKYK